MNFWTAPAQAEGSKGLVQNGGDRPYTEWSTATSANIERKTRLKVFVKNGETVNLGSSVHNSFDGKDIVFRSPSGVEQVCDVQESGEGFIDTVAKETAGPLPNLPLPDADGYTPCQFTADNTGIYEVEFHSPDPNGADPPPRATNEAFPTDNTQGKSVAAWDITVRDEDENTKNGRVFTNYMAINMGANNKFLNTNFLIQTKDGFLYQTRMNGIDPFGFLFFGNSRGFIDRTDNSTLYHSAKSDNNQLSPFQGNIEVQRPDLEDTSTDITHLVFFNAPDTDTLSELNIPLVPAIPTTPSNFKFTGGAGGSGNQTFVGVGGNFSFDSTSPGSYEIIIDSDEDGIFDPSKDRVLQSMVAIGSNVVTWDGKDPQGNNLSPRSNNDPYNARITLRTGEYHFPMLDVENNRNGFVIEMLNAPAAFPVGNRYTVYYNDDNYITSNGVNIDLSDSGATTPRNAATGIDSSSGTHRFSNNYGDFKGIDTWAYFPSEATFTNLIIAEAGLPKILLVKRITAINGVDFNQFVDDPSSTEDNNPNWPDSDPSDTNRNDFLRGVINGGLVSTGDELEYTIYFLSMGENQANQLKICDLIPTYTTFISTAFNGLTPRDGGLSSANLGIALAFDNTNFPSSPTAYITNVADSDRGELFPPGTIPSMDCSRSNNGINNNGAVVVNVADIVPTATNESKPTNAYGFIRFKVRVN
ncbi:MAG: hypothetical protein WA959_05360 [Rivularia sp. (in: cyanobacteria)]